MKGVIQSKEITTIEANVELEDINMSLLAGGQILPTDTNLTV